MTGMGSFLSFTPMQYRSKEFATLGPFLLFVGDSYNGLNAAMLGWVSRLPNNRRECIDYGQAEPSTESGLGLIKVSVASAL